MNKDGLIVKLCAALSHIKAEEDCCYGCELCVETGIKNECENPASLIKMCEKDEMKEIKYSLDPGAYAPQRAFRADAGADLRTPESFVIHAESFKVIDTGVHVQIDEGYAGMVKSKSGLMCKRGIVTDGTVDAGYSGSIRVCLFNHSNEDYEFQKGDKIAQLVILPIDSPAFVEVDDIESGERGEGGFGSTGR